MKRKNSTNVKKGLHEQFTYLNNHSGRRSRNFAIVIFSVIPYRSDNMNLEELAS